jgi:hypothetical protein
MYWGRSNKIPIFAKGMTALFNKPLSISLTLEDNLTIREAKTNRTS